MTQELQRDRDDCDLNRDPRTDEPGSHPAATGLGGAVGAAGGMAAGAMFGPIGLLIGGAIGTVAGAAVGHGAALEPTCEEDFWRDQHRQRRYARDEFDYERDYLPAYHYGSESRRHLQGRTWDDRLESELRSGWAASRRDSRLDWEDARDAVRDGWIRAERTYSAYADTDAFYAARWRDAPYCDSHYGFADYRNAFRYGTYARRARPNRQWDESLERELEPGWERARGESRLTWDQARHAARDAWHRVELTATTDSGRQPH